MDPIRYDWLGLTQETALDPEIPICDAHHHLWTHKGTYLIDEFLREGDCGHKVVSSVFVACEAMHRKDGPPEMQPVGETEFIERIASEGARAHPGRTAIAAGIVGFADLTLGAAVAQVLEAHLGASPRRFRGIRHTLTWDPSPAIRTSAPHPGPMQMQDPRFRAGFACLQNYGLSFDAWLFHPQLPELVGLAQDFPGVPIIVNHVGLPLGIGPYAGKRDEIFAAWKPSIAALAGCPNVFMKLGGLGMPRSGFAWDERRAPCGSVDLAEATAPYYRHCIEAFGPQRCMFESNFPVDKISYSYCVLWNSFKLMTRGFSVDERKALFCDTATSVYRLDQAVVAGTPG